MWCEFGPIYEDFFFLDMYGSKQEIEDPILELTGERSLISLDITLNLMDVKIKANICQVQSTITMNIVYFGLIVKCLYMAHDNQVKDEGR